jgi:predicted GH43/DUF377 family glycosyl hydrolase
MQADTTIPQRDLLAPAELAHVLEAKDAAQPRIIYVGFPNLYAGAHIRGAVLAGPASRAPGLDALKRAASDLPRSQALVIYCGCCPFDKCPNVRPAYRALKDLGFQQVRVLRINTNLHTDWVVPGYPTDRGHNSTAIDVSAKRISARPLLSRQGGWSGLAIFNPAAVKMDQKTVLLFRAQDAKKTSRIGYAESSDGLHFDIRKDPVLSPEAPYEKNGGVEDPRVLRINGTYYMTYTGYDTHSAQLCLATSQDLLHWQRRGVLLPAYKGTWNTQWTKSGAIVPEKINTKWWMYYLGTRTDADGKARDYMGLAQSDDLLHWRDATDQPVLPRRPGAFDERVMEPGPPPYLTEKGILLIYNGANDSLVYGPGWALFDRQDPRRLLARSEKPFMVPKLPWEKAGTVPNVIFIEGAIEKARPEGMLELAAYYGAADKYIGAAELSIRVPQ